ncbi:MAG: SCP2 sterol-binding domain-containing protein [Actinomycetota bacterium]
MAVMFQSEEYFAAANEAISASADVKKAAKGHNVAIQVVTTDYPEVGEKKTFLKIVNGVPEVGLGVIEEPTATISQNYATAVLLDKGELNPQTAFMEGKIKIKGNLIKIMGLQRFLQSIGPATVHIEREYEQQQPPPNP